MANSEAVMETERFIREEAITFSEPAETIEPVHRKSVTEYDAVHPRFVKENPEELRKYEIENMYFCRQCNLFFAPSVTGLKIHFKGDIVKHRPYGSCLYCKGEVYDYSINKELRVYHNCNTTEDTDSS